MKKLFFAVLSVLLITSCSQDETDSYNKYSSKEKNALVINSLSELNTLLSEMNSSVIDENLANEIIQNLHQTKVSIVPMFVGGYDKLLAYSGKEGLLFITSDGPTAQKLGIKWNHYYYLTIYQVNKQITSNGFSPSVVESPNCGLMLNSAMDDFLTSHRGYRGFYYPSTKVFSMNTSVLCFKDRSSATTTIWYPSNPSNFEWKFNAVWK